MLPFRLYLNFYIFFLRPPQLIVFLRLLFCLYILPPKRRRLVDWRGQGVHREKSVDMPELYFRSSLRPLCLAFLLNGIFLRFRAIQNVVYYPVGYSAGGKQTLTTAGWFRCWGLCVPSFSASSCRMQWGKSFCFKLGVHFGAERYGYYSVVTGFLLGLVVMKTSVLKAVQGRSGMKIWRVTLYVFALDGGGGGVLEPTVRMKIGNVFRFSLLLIHQVMTTAATVFDSNLRGCGVLFFFSRTPLSCA